MRDEPDLPPGYGRDLIDLLRRLATTQNPSNAQIAQKTGLSRSYVNEIRNGRKTPSPDAAEKIARALGGSPDDIKNVRLWAERWAETVRFHRRNRADRSAPKPDRQGGPHQTHVVPPLPPGFVMRESIGREILASLTASRDRPVRHTLGLGTTAGVHGTGGFGKTLMAAWACHQPEVLATFVDGIFWVQIGRDREPQEIVSAVRELTEAITRLPTPTVTSMPAAATILADALGTRRILLVVDDVWRAADLEPFLVGGPQCVRMVTTRRPSILPDGASSILVGPMSATEAFHLLVAGVPDVTVADVLSLFERSGRWPLLLGLLNGILRSMTMRFRRPVRETVDELLRMLNEHGLRGIDHLRSDAERAVAATLDVSLDELRLTAVNGDVSRERYLSLSIFSEDALVPFGVLARLWDCGDLETRRECERYAERSLLAGLDPTGVRLHDVIRAELRRHYDLVSANERLLNTFRKMLTDPFSWHTLPVGEAYMWEQLTYHLAQANNNDELKRLVFDLRFLAERIRRGGPGAIQVDLVRAATIQERNPWLNSLTRVVRLEGQLLDGLTQVGDIAATLHSRALTHPEVVRQLTHVDQMTAGRLVARMPFPDRPDPRLVDVLVGHRDVVNSVTWRPDGRFLTSSGADGTLRLWDSAAGTQLGLLDVGDDVRVVRWSPSYLYLAAATKDGRILLIDADEFSVVGHTSVAGKPIALCWQSDRPYLAVASAAAVLILSVPSLSELRRLAPAEPPLAMDWHGRSGLICCDAEGRLTYWRDPLTETGSSPRELAPVHASKSIRWHPDGDYLGVGGMDGTTTLVNPVTGEPRTAPSAIGDGAINSLDWTADGWLVEALNGGWVRIRAEDATAAGPADAISHAADAGTYAMPLNEHAAIDFRGRQVRDVAWHPSARTIAVAAHQRSITIWQAAPTPVGPSTSRIQTLRWSPDDSIIAAGTTDGELVLADPADYERRWTRQGHVGELRGLAWSPDSAQILTVGEDGATLLWDRATRDAIAFPLPRLAWPSALSWASKGSRIAVGDGTTVLVVDATGYKLCPPIAVNALINALAFDPSGDRLVVATANAELSMIHLGPAGPTVEFLRGHTSAINSVSWSRDGAAIVTAGYDGLALVWNAQSGAVIARLEHDDHSVWDADLHSASGVVLTVTSGGTASCWDAEGHRTSTLRVDGALSCGRFARTRKRAALGGSAGIYQVVLADETLPTTVGG